MCAGQVLGPADWAGFLLCHDSLNHLAGWGVRGTGVLAEWVSLLNAMWGYEKQPSQRRVQQRPCLITLEGS